MVIRKTPLPEQLKQRPNIKTFISVGFIAELFYETLLVKAVTNELALYGCMFRLRGEVKCWSVSVASVRCGPGNTSVCMLSVSRVAACSSHLTQIRDIHSSVSHEDLMSQQCYGSAAFRFCPSYFDSQSAVQNVTCVSCGCCVLSWQQHCVPPSLCWVRRFQ